MPRKIKESFVADSRLIVARAENVFLYIAHALHDEPNREQDHAHNIAPRPKGVLRILLHVGRVQHRHRQRDSPHPDHLEYPEAQEGEELVALVVEAVVLARLQDAEEQEAGQPETPHHDEERGDQLARIVIAAEGECDDGQNDKIGSSRKVWGSSVKMPRRDLHEGPAKVMSLPVSLSNLKVKAIAKNTN
jgi:hypothetical protein